MKELGSKRILTSAERLAEAENQFWETRDRIWINFLRRESRILLRRAFNFWWKIRFERGK